MKKILTLSILGLLFFSVGCEKGTPVKTSFTNPVFEPVLADPAIIEHEAVFYIYGTQDYGEWGEEFGTKVGPILTSTNLIDFEYAGSIFSMADRPTWGTAGAGLWAPDIVKIGDKFIIYYSLSKWGDPNPGIGIAISDHPLGPWEDKGKLFDSASIGVNNSIDATVFVDNDRVYMIWGSFRGLYGVELTSDGLALKDTNKVHIAGLDTSTNWNGSTYEAPYVIKIDNYFYMFVSSGTCCNGFDSTYNVRVSRSTSPLGPYLDSNGQSMLGTNRGHQVLQGSSFFKGPGHNAIIKDDNGDYFILYHAYDVSQDENYGNSPRRSLMIDKLEFDDAGWPSVKGLVPTNYESAAPFIKRGN